MIVLLHTSPVHVPVFDALRDRYHPGTELRHVVGAELLDRAVAEGPGAVAPRVAELIAEAAAAGAGSVLCTCSTLGAVAETAGAAHGLPVLRVDRPMAARAAREERIVVLAALASTLEPTAALIHEEAARAGRAAARVRTVLVDGAWELFAAGDRDGYLDRVAAAVTAVRDADVIVLAQASMADAADRATTAVPVLASPRTGLAAAVRAGTAGQTRVRARARRA
ncbi:aspartate/glutamate racemase family protein [Streptomyces yaizuensis]|uniref:Aspartate/glutamate racemase family protein n=1 Tax=Streptomyces yaizuensis TaxID=2989713 RepID=A0ABQ5NQX7_9ACTN|nr:aspartate/glutamate racemase family protein [Streptomyces sp. YSPA8]GLF92762.1 aspartate/glutamate racemase family protein [Streptomyces sp. YSPA8]